MNYKITNAVYEACAFGETQAKWSEPHVIHAAEEIANKWNELVETGKFLTLKKVNSKAFVRVKKYLEGFQLFRVDKNGNVKPREELSVNKKLNSSDSCAFSKEELLYICWVLKESGLYCGECRSLFAKLLEIIGLECDFLAVAHVEDVALNLVLQTDCGFQEFYELLSSWEEDLIEGSLQLPYVKNIVELNISQLERTVEAGMEEVGDIHATRLSVMSMEREFISVLRYGMFPEKRKFHEIFTEDFCQKILNTYERGKYYFFRIILRIVERQMEDILKAMMEYREANGKGGTAKLEALVSACWFEKINGAGNHSDVPWSKIAEGFSKVTLTIDQIREDMWNSRIRPSSIARAFNDAFSLYGFAFEKAIDDENQTAARNVAPRIQKLLMERNQKVSREILLLSVLLARANGIDEQMDMTYVKEHILYNSRFSKKLDEKDNVIDGYFAYMMKEFDQISCVEDRMDLLKKVSENLMWEVSENVFHDILYNKGGIGK